MSWEPFFEASLGHAKAHLGYLWSVFDLSKLLLVGEEVHGEGMKSTQSWGTFVPKRVAQGAVPGPRAL